MLKDLTIVTLDSLNHEATRFAIDKTLEIFPDADLIQIGDRQYHDKGRFYQVPKFDARDHSRMCLNMVPDLVETNYALFIQYDGFPTQAQYWDDEFLKYDYIGAPWNQVGSGWDVGNGGFSFRSKKLLNYMKMINPDAFGKDSPQKGWLEDQLICVTHRRWLMMQGIEYAPKVVANKFSHEHPTGYRHSFGFHGCNQVPYYLTDQEFTTWITAIDDSTFLNQNLLLTPYGLWKKDMWISLRALMVRGNKLVEDWNEKVWQELRWVIPHFVDPGADLNEIHQMVFRMGAPEEGS
jgi:hypothetical protein